MSVRSVKRWQWVIMGLLAGAIVGVAQLLKNAEQRIGGEGFISRRVFEQSLRSAPVGGRPIVSSIVIRPTAHVDVVTLQLLDASGQNYQEVRFAAARPYTPLGQSLPPNPPISVRDFLLSLSAANPALRPSYAWWDQSRVFVLIRMLIGAILIGGIWPRIVRILLGPPFREEVDFSGVKGVRAVPSIAQKSELSDEERAKLEELEKEMMAGLTPQADRPQAQSAVQPGTVKELATETVVDAPQAPQDDKDYAGEYYPVEKKTPHGFSLVELLVVIAILVLLLALLMPVLVTAQRQVEQTKCASNLRQIGMALSNYASANQGWMPAWSGWHTWPPGPNEQGQAWTIELIPYIGTPDSPVYNCPSFRSKVKFRNYFLAAQWSGKSNRRAMKFSDVTMSSRFVLSGDKTQRGLYPPPFGTNSVDTDDADPDDYGGPSENAVLAWPWDPGGFYMHRNGNNILFDDLHVAIFDRYDPYAMTFNPHKMEDWFFVTGEPLTEPTP